MSRVKVPFKAICPKGVSEPVWREVVDAWQNGLSDREAAFRASQNTKYEVKESDIKKWVKDSPDVGALRDYLQTDIISKAKLNIATKIAEGDIQTSKWYLERKQADEFSTKAAVAFEGAAIELSLEDKEKKMAEFMAQYEDE